MASFRIISSSTVYAAANHKEPKLKIDLTPWDLQLLQVDYIQKGLLFHKPPVQDNFIHHLKTSLSRTLDFFPPLVGRLAVTEHEDNSISFFINCNNDGAEFVHAAAEGVSVADITEPLYVPKIVYSFFPLNGIRNYEGTSKPLLSVQVTELVDGIFIACSINHSVVDGSSFWHFFNSWSEISQGFDSISKLPVLQRWFLRDSDCPTHIPPLKQLSYTFTPPPLQQRFFHFTKENIGKLKAKASDETGNNKISSLQALLSHIWRSAIRNKSLDSNEEIKYLLLIGTRPRLQPPLPQEYFGNAVQTGTVTMKAKDQLEEGLGYVALQMNKMIAMYTEEKIRNFLESWRESPRLLTMEGMIRNSFTTGSSPRFNVYGNDFGWGKPITVRSGPGNKFDGKITVFSGVEQGSIDIEACLLPETLQAMGNDAEFMDAVSNI